MNGVPWAAVFTVHSSSEIEVISGPHIYVIAGKRSEEELLIWDQP